MSLDLAGFKERHAGTGTLGRADLAKEVQREFPNISGVVMRQVVDAFFGVLGTALLAKKRVEVRGFGSLHAHRRNSRKSFIPSKGKISKVDAKWVVKFVTGKGFKAQLMASCEE